jgi:hypothetical protein
VGVRLPRRVGCLLTLFDLREPSPQALDINVGLGTAIVTLSLGGVLVYQAASSLGIVGSGDARQGEVPGAG